MNKNTIAAIILLLWVLDSGYFVERSNFTHLAIAYSAAFSIYFFVLKTVNKPIDIHFWFKIAFLLRGVLLFSVPNFSEDIYRFIWDGRLINAGINPFNYKPSHYFQHQLLPDILTPELYNKLNSKEYFTVYPPVCQGIFAFAVWLFPKSIYGSTLVIKSFLLASEIGTLLLLKKLLPNPKKVLIYALNPLIIIELCNNAHFEAAMIFFFLLSIYFLQKAQNTVHIDSFSESVSTTSLYIKSAFTFALSIASKMLPLMLLPFFIKRLGFKKSIYYFISIGIWLIILFSPLFNSLFFDNIKTSLNLYFTKFEFNASLYYVLREVGTSIRGYNPINEIAPILKGITLISFTLIFLFDWFKNKTTQILDNEGGIFKLGLWVFSIYFLCATTVHPWYASLPLVLSIFTNFKFIVAWTSILYFTYIHYSYPQPAENYWIIVLEYSITIGFFIYENIQFRQNKKESNTFSIRLF